MGQSKVLGLMHLVDAEKQKHFPEIQLIVSKKSATDLIQKHSIYSYLDLFNPPV